MKFNRNLFLLALAAVLLSLLYISQDMGLGIVTAVTAFPFEPLARLGTLGTPGSAFAWLLTAALTLIPLIPVMRRGFAKPWRRESILLCVLAALIPAAVWCMANPALLANALPVYDPEMQPVLHAVLGGTVWSFAVVWLVLYLLRLLTSGGRKQIFDCLRVILYVICLLFGTAVMITLFLTIVHGKEAAALPADLPMAILRAVAAAVPNILNGAIALVAVDVLDALAVKEGAVSDEAEAAAFIEDLAQQKSVRGKSDLIDAKLAQLIALCKNNLILTTCLTAGLNLLQLLLSPYLSDLQTRLELPVMGLAFTAAVFIVARLITENRRLSDENDLFI